MAWCNPECPHCGSQMIEIESDFCNSNGEREVTGFECIYCKIQIDLKGNEKDISAVDMPKL